MLWRGGLRPLGATGAPTARLLFERLLTGDTAQSWGAPLAGLSLLALVAPGRRAQTAAPPGRPQAAERNARAAQARPLA